MKLAVALFRVSTKRQAKSGLGLDVQQIDVDRCLSLHGLTLAKEYFETESGMGIKRRELRKALRYCKKIKAALVISKIDRLSRNALLVATLIASGVTIIAADKPHATHLELLEDAIRAQREGEAISKRTKDALAAAKARGVQLGKYGIHVLSKINREAADRFARDMQPKLLLLHERGFKSCRAKAAELNRRKVPTYWGMSYKWHATTVYHLQKRIIALRL